MTKSDAAWMLVMAIAKNHYSKAYRGEIKNTLGDFGKLDSVKILWPMLNFYYKGKKLH